MANTPTIKGSNLAPGSCEYESKGSYLPVNEEHAEEIAEGKTTAADGHSTFLKTTKTYECNYVCKDDSGDVVQTTGLSTDSFYVDNNNAALCEGVSITTEDNPYNISQPLPVPHTSAVPRSSINEVGPVRVLVSRALQRAVDTGDIVAATQLSDGLLSQANSAERRQLFGLLLQSSGADGALTTAERLLSSATPEERAHLVRNARASHAEALSTWATESEIVDAASQRADVLALGQVVAAGFGKVMGGAASNPAGLTADDVAQFAALAAEYASVRKELGYDEGYPHDALTALLTQVSSVRPELAGPIQDLVSP